MAKRKKGKPQVPTEAVVAKFQMLSPMLDSALKEMGEFSKKKQDGVLNDLKVKVLNRLLRDIRKLLGSDPSTEYLELLAEQTLPQNSDAVLILGQYRAAMDQFEAKHYGYDKAKHVERWFTKENPRYGYDY